MIEVRIPVKKLTDLGHDVHRGILVLNALRDAGVPVVGTLFPIGVERGALTTHAFDPFENDYCWTWSEQ